MQPVPETLHLTEASAWPVSIRTNCRLLWRVTRALPGHTLRATSEVIVSAALADLLRSAREVAVTDTVGGTGTTVDVEL